MCAKMITMTKLLIVESPAKAKTISKYLDDKYTVRASVGHVRDLPKSNKKAIDIEGGFVPHYEISKGKEKVIHDLHELSSKATEIVLATDPDREGEAIAWHLFETLKLPKKKTKRITFHEITKEAVQEAMGHPRDIDTNLRRAQEARRVLDRLVGYDLSGLIWKKVRYGLSAGRVQSPALRIIMEREREIRAFIPEQYFILSADVETKKKERFTVTCVEEPRDEKEAERIHNIASTKNWNVDDVESSEAKRTPRPPFITSTLQQSASSRLGFAPSRTMRIAQKLYEAGHITYMRTDSLSLAESARKSALAVIAKNFGNEYMMPRLFKSKSKNAQEAHEAIRPSHMEVKSAGTTPEEKKLYELIWRRTIATQMADAKVLKTKILALPEGETVPHFTATGSHVIFEGWLAADPAARGEDVDLPQVASDDPLTMTELHKEAKMTEPPGRYTEAGLIKELEKRGIGRPSTYASIMNTLATRGYVNKEGKTLFPTDTGDVVSSFLEKYFEKYISDTFTAEMEDELDEISRGEREYEKTLKDFYKPFLKDVKVQSKDAAKITDLGDVPKEFKCPICGGNMVWKLARNGKFMSCAKFPECTGARQADGSEMAGPKETGEACPECKDGKLIERMGKFGPFVACSNYPKCKYIKKDAFPPVSSGVKCPECKEGEIVERKGRFGPFWSCSNYPKCRYAIKAKPTGQMCKECNSLMMEGTKTIPERCSNKVCPNHNPHKKK